MSRRQGLIWTFIIGATVAAILTVVWTHHPYPQDLLNGRIIQGRTWSELEGRIRDHVHGRGPVIDKGPFRTDPLGGSYYDEEMLPLLLVLADDQDVAVRRAMLGALSTFLTEHRKTVEPRLRKFMNDDDGQCRVWAAGIIWQLQDEQSAFELLERESKHGDPNVRHAAIER